MNFRNCLLYSLLPLTLSFNAQAANLIIDSGQNMSTDWDYSSNSGSYGISGGAGYYDIQTNGYDINANYNLSGIYNSNSGQLNFIGDGTNKITANYNNSGSPNAGAGISSEGTGTIVINNMNIDANSNYNVGIGAMNSGVIKINGNGSNSLTANNNINSPSNLGYGIVAQDLSSIEISNMQDITLNNNKVIGIYASNSSKVNINSTDEMIINMVGNGTAGIRVSDSELNIYGTNKINIDINNSSFGIVVDRGSNVDIASEDSSSNLYVGAHANAGLYVYDQDSKLTIENFNIIVSKIGSYGIYATNNGAIEINGSGSNIVMVADNGSHGIYANNGTIDINNSDVELTRNDGYGIFAKGVDGRINIKSDLEARDMLLKDNTLAGISADEKGSEVNITNMNIISENNTTFTAKDSAAIRLDGVNVMVLDNSLLFDATDGYGHFAVKDSYISNRVVSSGGYVGMTLENSHWDMNGDSNIDDLSIENSSIKFSSGPAAFSTLTVDNYHVNNASLYLNTYFDGDGTSTDKLVITQGSTGHTTLFINSIGTNDVSSSGDGIMVVDQTTATRPYATFSLYGGVVDTGFYEYGLHQGSNNSWYLKSNGSMTNTARTISNIPAIHLNIVKTGQNELRKRMGELRDNDPEHQDGLWARSYAKHLKVNETIDSSMNLYGFEMGYDKQIYSSCDDKVYAGIMAGYLYTDNIKTRQTQGVKGTGHANTPHIGAYATWVNYDGWFADATVRSFWSNMETTAYSAQGMPIHFEPSRQFTASTLEFGRQMAWYIDAYSKYILEPKVEFGYAYSKAKSFNTSALNKLYYGSTDSISGKAGVMTAYNTELENGSIIQPFLEFNIIQEWGGVTDIRYANGYYKSNVSGTSIEFGGGLNAKINNNWNFYSDIMYETGSVIKALSTTLGIRYNF